ncbi:hypothetical protein FRB94_014483 [Tulasnella sp. JGI-2019a]|nr:hypothetical protein FRB94_014483 [Tulasnella sp. JGI-2019a]
MHQIIANSRRSYNAGLPIYQLPQELMSNILTLETVQTVDEHSVDLSYMRRLQEFASVSSAWARLIKNTPSFWTKVSDEYPLPLLHQTFLQSKGNLLDVKVTGRVAIDIISANPFASLVSDHIGRWRSFDIYDGMWSPSMIQALCSAAAPALETLRLASEMHVRQVGTIFCGKADRLRDVHITRACIPWDTDILKGLISLNLEDIGDMGPTIDQLLDILSASPGLTTLHLNAFYISDEVEDLNTNRIYRQPGFLELSLLRTLQISHLDQQLERAIFSAVRLEGRTEFSLTADLWSIDGLFHDLSFANPASFVRMSLASSEELTFTYAHMRGDTLSDGFVEAIEEIGSLHNRLVIRKAAPGGITPLLLSRCSFTTIELHEANNLTVFDLMRFLAIPFMVDDAWGWPAPDLEELKLSNASHAEPKEIIKMITTRYGGGEARAGVTHMEVGLKACTPIRLRIQNGSPFKRRHLRILDGVLGKTNIIYDTARYPDEEEEDDDSQEDMTGTENTLQRLSAITGWAY